MVPVWQIVAAVGVVGAVIGSFLNVCIHRLPLGESVVRPGSRCPSCRKPIHAIHNIPILSFVALGGRCRWCREPISWRYPMVEAINAVGYIMIWNRFGSTLEAAVFAAFFSSLVVVTFIDWDHQIIPNRITLPGIVIGLISAATVLSGSFVDGLLGAILGGGLLFAIAVGSERLLKKEGMGMGDVKFLAMVGAFLGWKAVLVTIFVGALLGSIIGLVLLGLRIKRRGDPIPFGPFLALGACAALFAGPELMAWYLQLGA